jgi:GMP synthase-like glutamine amidotransferase
MNIHIVMHASFEGPGNIVKWAEEKGHKLSYTKTWESALFPDFSQFECLIIMGGPMGVYDEEVYPWLKDEKQFIKKTIDASKSVIGICLGSQLIATCLGAKVFSNLQNEIGWFPIQLCTEASKDMLFKNILPEQIVFHWHGDTFDLPEGAMRIASSKITQNQGFIYKNNVLALQFHLEMSENSIDEITKEVNVRLIDSPYVQTAPDIRQGKIHIANNYHFLSLLLDRIEERTKL